MSTLFYGELPFSRPVRGTPSGLRAQTGPRLRELWARDYPLQDAVLALVGDIDLPSLLEHVKLAFGTGRRGHVRKASSKTTAPRLPTSPRERTIFKDREQAHVALGFPGLCIGAAQAPALDLLSTVLGGQIGRLFTALREREGLVYEVSVSSLEGRDVGHVLVHASGPALAVDGLPLRAAWDLVTALEHLLPADCLGFAADRADPVPTASIVLADPALVFCRGAQVEPGVVFDTRGGEIVLEAGVEVRHGTRLEGPLYAVERSRLLGGHLRASVFGPRSSVKGEVSKTLFLGYANKSHDGFVGHSVLCHWVNLGALTTTSNLKNTYGAVQLAPGGTRLETGRQFLGTLFGDHANGPGLRRPGRGALQPQRRTSGRPERGACVRNRPR